MDKKLRIVIASVGRFHVLDLARELHAIGHDVTFISIVPKWRADQFGLPRGCLISLFWICTPLIGLHISPQVDCENLSNNHDPLFGRDRRLHNARM